MKKVSDNKSAARDRSGERVHQALEVMRREDVGRYYRPLHAEAMAMAATPSRNLARLRLWFLLEPIIQDGEWTGLEAQDRQFMLKLAQLVGGSGAPPLFGPP